jgi:tungstate transport system substrate-binding protein
MIIRVGVVFLAGLVMLTGCGARGEERIIIGAGTTLVDSGFIQHVVDTYEAEAPDVSFSVVGLSSAEAVAYAEAGNAQIIFTHEPGLLEGFLAADANASTVIPFASEFLLVGPSHSVESVIDVVDAFGRISLNETPFVSRDDGSGTNAREREIWAKVPFEPSGASWYIRSGSGMVASLLVADQRNAVTLAERGAFLAAAGSLDLVVIQLESDVWLENPYDMTVIGDAPDQALLFQEWMMSQRGRGAIIAANSELFGTQVYVLP